MSSITGQDKIRGVGKECDLSWCAIVLQSVSVASVTSVSGSAVVPFMACCRLRCDSQSRPRWQSGTVGRPISWLVWRGDAWYYSASPAGAWWEMRWN